MKKVLWLAVIAFAAFSCKDDEKDVNVSGTWVETSMTTTGCNDEASNGSVTDANGCEDAACTTYNFDSGTLTILATNDGDEFEVEFPYTVNGSSINIMGQKITAKRSGNTLTLTTKDSEDGCTAVTTLSFVE